MKFHMSTENADPDTRNRQPQYLAQEVKTAFNLRLLGAHPRFLSQGIDSMARLVQMFLSERGCFS